MSDINHGCPTPCSSCDRTRGKCESCIKVDAILTPERIADIQEAAEAEWLGAGGGSHQLFMTTFARAISREVVAILAPGWQPIETALKDGTPIWAYQPFETGGEQVTMYWTEGEGFGLWVYTDLCLQEVDPDPTPPTHWMPLPDAPATPAASGIGESGGE